MLRLKQARGLSAAARTDLGSFHLWNCTFGKFPLGELHIWEVFTWGNAHLGSFNLGNCTFRKFQLWELHIWEVSTWENTLGKFLFGQKGFVTLFKMSLSSFSTINIFEYFGSGVVLNYIFVFT